jgi:hypothetical protein
MRDAYQTAAFLSDRLIEKERPGDSVHLRRTQVVVVAGKYDHGENVLDLCGIPCTRIHARATEGLVLDPDQILFVNCPGELPRGGLERVRDFVDRGGMLVTTDWALRHVVEPAFPGTIAYNERPTQDDVVRVVFEPVEDTFLEGLLDGRDDPLWWLEGSSYPIAIRDPRVKVLVSSQEMKGKYGEAPIVVAFEHGLGKVYHMTSHFYLQRTETRTKRHAAAAQAYLEEKGLDAAESRQLTRGSQASLGEVQSAYTSARSIKNMIIEQGRRSTSRRFGQQPLGQAAQAAGLDPFASAPPPAPPQPSQAPSGSSQLRRGAPTA